MADEFDVEAMLEAPYKKEVENSRSDDRKSKDKSSSRHGSSRHRSRSRDRDRNRDKKRGGSKDRKDRRRSRSGSRGKERRHQREGRNDVERRRRSRSRSRDRKSSKSQDHKEFKRRSWSMSPIRNAERQDMTPEERDARTVFCMQLSARIRPRDLEEFFSSVGKVRDVRIITDNKTRRSKGIAYIEFKDTESVPLAMGLTGQRLLGVPIIVQPSQAEKNRQQALNAAAQKGISGPMRLYVGSLHFNITEDMLRGIFEPFGKIAEIKLIRKHETTQSQGYGFITFHNADDAKKALEQLNGFELAGRPMKVGHVTERANELQGTAGLDTDEMDRAGVDLGTTGRLQLMAKLAEGTGFEIPQAAATALNMNNAQMLQAQQTPPIATQCFMLSNMFDLLTETSMAWDTEIRDDVIEECNKHGGVLHIYVDKASPQGNVYVKCPSISAAVASVNALHGRFFAGKVITAAYVPLPNYHSLFPDALRATQLLISSTQSGGLLSQSLMPAGVPPPPQFM